METAVSKTEGSAGRAKLAMFSAKMALTGLCMGISPVLTVHANNQDGSSSDLGVGQVGVEDIIKSGKSLDDSSLGKLGEKVDDIGGGGYNLFFKVGTYAIVIGFVVAGILLIFAGAPKREEAKAKVGYIIGGAVLIFGAVVITATIQKIATGLFGV